MNESSSSTPRLPVKASSNFLTISFDEKTSTKDIFNCDGVFDGKAGAGVVPQAYIQPPAEQIDKNNATKCDIPPTDLSRLDGPDHDEVVNQIVRAAETLGFFQVINHGVPVELLDSLKQTAHNFFALPAERKAVYRKEVSPSPLVKYGTSFVPEKEKALEWKDYISMAYTNDAEAMQQWPVECADDALQYLKTSHEMVRKLLDALMGNLGVELDDSKIDAFIGKEDDGIGGLYVRVPENVDMEKKGEWVEIPPIPGALVINVGDMLQIWSNGRYKSAEHRVRTTSTKSRVSIPIFASPEATQKIAPLPQVVKKDGVARYTEFLFSDYMNNFFGNVHDGKK
ncbi:2-oxoglutarate and Fe(II)-dependent oxygenase superfamily protein [Hibiscus syriacus]|uniref:2-oxoglutarate and Fe(II)-dependent oxygenase superfamily protein n=1 Tax=Hibiscus syriacus TaxID=106335 RepID=A0A6A3AIC4_HIBSY|nr:2-oxoglutarate and Fe(II)-dependent oxygenase superfamily protein [Hibiscus syriacus]